MVFWQTRVDSFNTELTELPNSKLQRIYHIKRRHKFPQVRKVEKTFKESTWEFSWR